MQIVNYNLNGMELYWDPLTIPSIILQVFYFQTPLQDDKSENNVQSEFYSETNKFQLGSQVMNVISIALCYSVEEYACPVWSRSIYMEKRWILLLTKYTEYHLKPTPVGRLYELCGIE